MTFDYSVDKWFKEIPKLKQMQWVPDLEDRLLEYFIRVKEENKNLSEWQHEMKASDDDIQAYSRRIDMPCGDFFHINWNITKLLQIIKTEKIKPELLSTSFLMNFVDVKKLDPEYIQVAKHNKKPVITLIYEPTQQPTPVDGNHRIAGHYESVLLKKKDRPIRTFILNEQVYKNAFLTGLDQALYNIHRNLMTIHNLYNENKMDIGILERELVKV